MNRVILMGRLTADPEMRYTSSGTAVTNFTLAIDRQFKNAQGEKVTDFIEVVAWRKTAEFAANFVRKGKRLLVEGRLEIQSYEDRDGNKRRKAQVVADNVEVIDWPEKGNELPADEPLEHNDVPF